ncbi:MAG: hypothetical protein KDD36_06020 [Flavobacteriales bacterium]|nr:hypothetical protein [Flavobacteriales bacterium]
MNFFLRNMILVVVLIACASLTMPQDRPWKEFLDKMIHYEEHGQRNYHANQCTVFMTLDQEGVFHEELRVDSILIRSNTFHVGDIDPERFREDKGDKTYVVKGVVFYCKEGKCITSTNKGLEFESSAFSIP